MAGPDSAAERPVLPFSADRRARVLYLVLALLTLLQVLMLVYAFHRRWGYPYSLHQIEDYFATGSWYLGQGVNVYAGQPQYLPGLYPPLLPLLAGALFHAGRNPRLLSLLATFIMALCAVGTVRVLRGRWSTALLGGALSLLLFWNTGREMDTIRPDVFSLAFLAFSVLLVVWGLRQRSSAALLLGGIVTGLAALTNQRHLALGLFWIPGLWLYAGGAGIWTPAESLGGTGVSPVSGGGGEAAPSFGRRAAYLFGAAFLVVFVAGYACYTARFGPGVLRWVFRIPLSHPQEWRRLPDVLLFCLLVAPALPYLLATRRRNPALRLLLWPLIGTGLAGLAAFLKAGGVPNSLVGPGYLLALCTGFILEDAFTAPVSLRPALLGLLLLVVGVMGPGRGRLYTGAFPDAADRAAMDELTSVVRTLPGDQLFMPFNGLFVARAAGKPPPPFYNSIAADRQWAHLPLQPDVTAGLDQGRYDDIIGPLYRFRPLVGSQYLFLGTLVRLDPHPYDAADSMDRGNFPRELWVRRDLWTPDNARHVEALLGHLQYLGWLPPPGGLPPS